MQINALLRASSGFRQAKWKRARVEGWQGRVWLPHISGMQIDVTVGEQVGVAYISGQGHAAHNATVGFYVRKKRCLPSSIMRVLGLRPYLLSHLAGPVQVFL